MKALEKGHNKRLDGSAIKRTIKQVQAPRQSSHGFTRTPVKAHEVPRRAKEASTGVHETVKKKHCTPVHHHQPEAVAETR